MSSRIRNSESQRGIEGENLSQGEIRERHPRPRKEGHSTFRGVNTSKWSDVETNSLSKTDDDGSTWPSWDSSPGDNNVKRDARISDTRHKIPAEPAFDGRGRQHHSRPLDDSWSDPQRVRGSARNRSRDRDRSRSRSRFRGKGRSRSRSRSRSWERGEGGERGRSRSPFHDDRNESNANNIDRISGPRLPSRACRDFAMGKCRRGTNCRFLHQDNLNSQGGKPSDNEGASRYSDNRDSIDRTQDKVSDGSKRYSEKDGMERSGSRPDYGGGSRYGDNRTSADRPRSKVYDGTRRYNNVEDEPVRDNHNRGNRNASYNHNGEGPHNRSGKVPCKYFLIGKCHREDCRFSHDAPLSEGVDGRSRDDRLGQISDEKNKAWNGPTWDDLSNSTKSTGLHDSSFNNLNPRESTTYEKHADVKNKSWDGPTLDEVNASNLSDIAKSSTNKRSYDSTAYDKPMDDKNVSWNGPVWNDKAVERNEYVSPGANTDAYMGTNEYMSRKKVDGNEETQLIYDRSQSQTLDEISKPSHERNIMLNAPATFDDSNILDVDMVSEDSTYPVVNLSGPEHDMYPPSTQPIQTRINQNEVPNNYSDKPLEQVMPEMSETVVSSEQVAQITDLPAILNQISQNEQLPQIIAALNPNNGTGLVHSIPTSTSVPNSTIVTGEEHQRRPKSNQQGQGVSEEVKNVGEKIKQEQEKNRGGSSDARGIVEEGSIANDEKAMRLFKNALIDFVKEILKPTWKEGGMSREVHKTVVKKVVDKVTSTVQGVQIPRTQEKIEQYLAFSKSKITKLVAAYVERLSKAADA